MGGQGVQLLTVFPINRCHQRVVTREIWQGPPRIKRFQSIGVTASGDTAADVNPYQLWRGFQSIGVTSEW